MIKTIQYDSDWELYEITLTDKDNNVLTLDYYIKPQHKLYYTHLEFSNGKTCSGRLLKANRTTLSNEEHNTIKEFRSYIDTMTSNNIILEA